MRHWTLLPSSKGVILKLGCHPHTAGTPGDKRQLAASRKASQPQRQTSTASKKENSAGSDAEEMGTSDAQPQVSPLLTLSTCMISVLQVSDTIPGQSPLFPEHEMLTAVPCNRIAQHGHFMMGSGSQSRRRVSDSPGSPGRRAAQERAEAAAAAEERAAGERGAPGQGRRQEERRQQRRRHVPGRPKRLQPLGSTAPGASAQ